jgi:hypothetical protein
VKSRISGKEAVYVARKSERRRPVKLKAPRHSSEWGLGRDLGEGGRIDFEINPKLDHSESNHSKPEARHPVRCENNTRRHSLPAPGHTGQAVPSSRWVKWRGVLSRRFLGFFPAFGISGVSRVTATEAMGGGIK